jgi:hypothetical protein
MAKAITVLPKRPGRPATGRDPVTAIRLPPGLAAEIDKWAKHQGVKGRSAAIRLLVQIGLAAQPKAGKK